MSQPMHPVFASEEEVIAYIQSPAFRMEGLEFVGQPTITNLVFHPLTLEQEPMCLVVLSGTCIFAPLGFLDPEIRQEEQRQPVKCSLQVMFDCQRGEFRGYQTVSEHPISGPPLFATQEDVRRYLGSEPFSIHRIQGVDIPTIESIEMKGGRCRVKLSGLFWFVAPAFVNQRRTEPTRSRVCAIFDCQTGFVIEAGFC